MIKISCTEGPAFNMHGGVMWAFYAVNVLESLYLGRREKV